MTNPEKLNAILYVLLNEVTKDNINPKLNFDFICRNVAEVKEEWEINFLRNLLKDDEYIFLNPMIDVPPKITHKGIKFIQSGGYKKEVENRDLERKIKIETLKSLKRSKGAFIIACISVILSAIIGYSNYKLAIENKNKISIELKSTKNKMDSISNILKRQKLKQNSKQ